MERTSSRRQARAGIVIGADGRRSFVGPDGRKPDGAEFWQREDELAYVLPGDAGVTCVALSLNLANFAWLRLAPEKRFHERLAGLAERVRAAEVCGPVLGSGPLPNYVRVPAGSDWALVGDAGLHQDPWSGLGMEWIWPASTRRSWRRHCWHALARPCRSRKHWQLIIDGAMTTQGHPQKFVRKGSLHTTASITPRATIATSPLT